MNRRVLSPLLLSLALGQAAALTVTGTVEGAGPDTRISGFVVSAYGQPLQEVVSVPVDAGRFRLEVPATAPTARAQVNLTPQNVSWPGVIDPVAVSAPTQAAELKFFAYRDENRNGRQDEGEALREVAPSVGKANLFIVWVNADVKVTANKGYEATLKRGWNAFIVDVGRAVKVTPFSDDRAVTVRMGR